MSIDLILMIVACICFVVAFLSEFGVVVTKSLAFVAAGLFFWALTAIV